MSKIARKLLLSIFLFGLQSAASGQSATYAFTGSVTSGSINGDGIFQGSLVNGTVTFDFNAADPSITEGSNSTDFFDYGSYTAPSLGSTLFSTTASVDGLTYQTTEPVATDTTYGSAIIGGSYGTLDPGAFYFASESQGSAASYGSSSLFLGTISSYPFDGSGFPDAFSSPAPSIDAGGDFLTNSASVYWNITSLTPLSYVTAVPELPSSAAVLLELFCLAVATKSQQLGRRSRIDSKG